MILVRLRVPLRLKSREMREAEALTGMTCAPIVVPARTDLEVVELELERALVLTPNKQKAWVSRETFRDHAYTPRVKR